MRSRLPLILLLVGLFLWLAAAYGIRYLLMENVQWVGTCVDEAQRWECQVRSALGYLIHFRLIAWSALALALLAFFVSARPGRPLAVVALSLALPAMVLYSASLAVFAVVIAALRLVRAPKAAH
jgi:hypothetical protein